MYCIVTETVAAVGGPGSAPADPGSAAAETAWPPGTEVGLIEGCAGRRMHGRVALVETDATLVWIPDLRHAPPIPCAPHGYMIVMDAGRIASGAMWAEPLPASLTGPEPTVEDVADYWAWARNVGAVAAPSANSYISALRAVFAGRGAGMATPVLSVELEPTLKDFTAARGILGLDADVAARGRTPKTLKQYSTSARSAVRNYRIQREYALAPHTGAPAWAAAGPCGCTTAESPAP